ncbi:MAG: FtsX-like permease family protein [Bacteroidales bacterium]|jgi:lipoprotein-releasing system permease protein|nr:FtsX-like permease family protein [Bacteroidales bacterium]
MKISFLIAKRYFLSKKTRMTNLTSVVALLSVAVCSAAMIIILSVMNGMNSFVSERFSRFDPDLKIEKKYGKYFDGDEILSEIANIADVNPVIETQAIIRFDNTTRVVVLKGSANKQPSTHYTPITVGEGIAANLGISSMTPVSLFTMPVSELSDGGALDNYNSFDVVATDFLTTIPDYDNRYVVAPLAFVQQAIEREGMISAIEIFLDEAGEISKGGDAANIADITAQIQKIVGNNFTVKNRLQQQALLYSSMKAEKMIIILIFIFVMLIACFTLIASLMLLISEKRKDKKILLTVGLKKNEIQNIFLLNGIFITIAGTIAGLALGIAVVLCQQYFGWLKLGGSGGEGKYIVEAYPVLLQSNDVGLVFAVSVAVGIFASLVSTFSRQKTVT